MGHREIVASSKIYRKVNNDLADALGLEPGHTKSPSDDFARLVEQVSSSPGIDERELSTLAKRFYQMGVRRGLIHATDLMTEGHFFMKGGACCAEGDTTLVIRVRMPDGNRVRLNLEFQASDLGFTD